MEHQDHIAILKLRRNEPLTPTDLGELERMFLELGIDNRKDVEKICSGKNIGIFVRSIIGLDRAAAKEAFSGFLQERNLTASQLDFVNMIIDHLTARGIIEPALLYASPFTDMDPLGVAGVFAEREVLQIVSILEDIRKRAAA